MGLSWSQRGQGADWNRGYSGNNENYNIYCTDELSARKFLTPKMLNGLIDSQNAMCVFLKDKKLFISFVYRSLYLSDAPKNQKILINYPWYLNIINYAEN